MMANVLTRGRDGSKSMNAPRIEDLQVKLFTDGADKAQILDMAQKPWIKGFTTNPSLLRKAGVTDYEAYGRDLVAAVPDRHISFEVFSDDLPEMVAQARLITTWGDNVYVKLPVTDTEGKSMAPLVRELSEDGVKVNVTALFTTAQVELITSAVKDGAASYVSVFAGRIADAGVDPIPIMRRSVEILSDAPRAELIWASPREALNLVQADEVGCHVITMTHDLLAKLPSLGKSLDQFSLETVQMFRRDAVNAGFSI